MADTFDPYHRWLAILPKDQPPTHYRLLGIDPSESDPEVIRDAAEARMAHVRTYQLGKHSELSQKILNELAAAKACLLDPKSKVAYDSQLSARARKPSVVAQVPPSARQRDVTESIVVPDPPTLEPPLPPPVDSDFTHFIENLDHAPSTRPQRLREFLSSRSRKVQWIGVSLTAVALMLLLGVIFLVAAECGAFKKATEQGRASGSGSAVRRPETSGERPKEPEIDPAATSKQGDDARVEDLPDSDFDDTDVSTRALQSIKLDPSLASMPGAGTTVVNAKDGSQLVLIPAGEFLAGKEKFKVTLPAFYIGLHEVTNRQYKRFIDATGHRPPGISEASHPVWRGNRYLAIKADHPVVGVDWQDAQAYCDWAGLRLPRELEWEEAARGVDGRQFPWGDQWESNDKCRSHFNTGSEQTCDVIAYPAGASPWGVMHTSGNVAEWTADWAKYDDYFARYGNGILPPLSSGQGIVVRGGSWPLDDTNRFRCWVRHRLAMRDSRDNDLGFRVAKSGPSVVGKPEEKAPAPTPKPVEAPNPVAPKIDAAEPPETPTIDAFQSRHLPTRARTARAGGGTGPSENAVERGLQWLAAHQRVDGSWCFDLTKSPCEGKCRNSGSEPSTVAATGLALLPFLGAGYTPSHGKHRLIVKKGLQFLSTRAVHTPHGIDLRDGGNMYGHGIATLALCEFYGMTHDTSFKTLAQDAIRFIVHAQDPQGGGWRYEPGSAGDTSVTGWQLAALKTAKMAQLEVPRPTMVLAQRFLDGVQYDQGAKYGYLPSVRKEDAPEAMTAAGLLCRMYTGWQRDRNALQRGVALLHRWGPSETNVYYDYYATQVLHQWGGREWQAWNMRMRDHLIVRQAFKDHEAGSWHFQDSWDKLGGRLYHTAMAVMILEVYYRHMPLYGKNTTSRH
jgi:formylglycine-generating enzyme required for sulfatase activity